MYHPCLLFHVGSRSLILIRIHPIPSFPDEREAALFHLQYLPIFLPSFHLNICAMMQSNTEMCYVPRAHSFLCFPRLCLELNPRRYSDSRSFQRVKDTATKRWNVCWCKGPCLRSDQISHCRSKIRSATPEETVKETKKRKAKNLQTCSVIDSPFFSPRELISLKCNTNPLIKLSRETISVYNSKPVCSDSE